MITVHHLNASRSHRVLWLLEELGAPYEVVRYQRNPQTMLAPPELRRIHPLGKSPVITDEGRTIAESGAIIEYLNDRYGNERFVPPRGSDEFLAYRYWLHYAEGSAMPPLLLKLVFQRVPKAVPAIIRPLANVIFAGAQKSYIDPQLATHVRYWEGELGKNPWFAGPEFTAADIQMSFPVQAAMKRAAPPRAGGYPNIQKYLDRIVERPAYQRAVTAGGGFELLA